MKAVRQDTEAALAGIAAGSADALAEALGVREPSCDAGGLDGRTFSLVKLAALIAVDAPPASYAWQVGHAREFGVTADDMLGVLRAVAPQVGLPRVVAAAPEIILALGLPLPKSGA